MTDLDLSSLGGFNLSDDQMSKLLKFEPTYTNHIASQVQNDINKSLRAVERSRAEKEAEELRRHDELVGAVRELNATMKETVLEAIKMGASVNIDSNTGNINISMNSQNVQQEISQNAEIDYNAAESTLKEIAEFFDMPKFEKDFGEKADEVKRLVADLLVAVQEQNKPGIIKAGFNKLKELATGIKGSLIASAIFEGIKKIPGLFL